MLAEVLPATPLTTSQATPDDDDDDPLPGPGDDHPADDPRPALTGWPTKLDPNGLDPNGLDPNGWTTRLDPTVIRAPRPAGCPRTPHQDRVR